MSKKIIIQDLVSETGEIGKVTVIGDDTPAPTPTGTISITENGTYDVAEFAEAEVEVENKAVTLQDTVLTIYGITGVDAFTLNLTQGPDHNYGTIVTCSESTDVKKITINAPNKPKGNVQFRHGSNSQSLLEEIEINGVRLSSVYQSFEEVFSERASLRSIHTLDLSLCGGGGYTIGDFARRQTKLTDLRIVPNTCGKKPLSGYSGNSVDLTTNKALSDNSLISVANGLNATNTSTVRFASDLKAKCSNIMGSVSQASDDDGVYDYFTRDDSGTVTLADFITQIKGWTLA